MSKKRGQNEGTIRKRKDGLWEGRYSLGFQPNGAPNRKSIYGKTRQAVSQRLANILTDINNKTYIENKDIKFYDWLMEWLEVYAKGSISPSTYTSYETYIRGHLKPYFIKTKLSDLTATDLQKFINYKQGNGRLDGKSGGISPKTIKNMKNMIHAALQQALMNNLVSKNISELVRTPKNHQHEMRVLTPEEQTVLIQTAKGFRTGTPIILALYTGLRLGEILALTVKDVDFKKEKLYVRTSLKRQSKDALKQSRQYILNSNDSNKTVLVVGDTKTYTSRREVDLIPEAIEVLKVHIKLRDQEIKEAGSAYNQLGFLFADEIGRPYDQRTYTDHFNKILQASGIQKVTTIGGQKISVTFHTLRHTFATRALESGMDIFVLSRILGHAQASTTLNKYGHALPDHKKASMEKIRTVLGQG